MNRSKKIVYHPYIIRASAVALTLFMVFQLWVPAIIADTDSPGSTWGDASPVVYFRGEPIENDMEVSSGGLSVRYRFKASRRALAGAEGAVALPERLLAIYETTETITGTDSHGDTIDVGELTVEWVVDEQGGEQGKVYTRFFSSLAGSDAENATQGVTATEGVTEATAAPQRVPALQEVIEATAAPERVTAIQGGADNEDTAENTADDEAIGNKNVESENEDNAELENEDNTGPENEMPIPDGLMPSLGFPDVAEISPEEIDPDEEITVDFFVRVEIDVTGIDPNEDNTYTVAIESGGETVTVTLVPLDVANLQQPVGAQGRAVVATAGDTGEYTFFPSNPNADRDVSGTDPYAAKYNTGYGNGGIDLTKDKDGSKVEADTLVSSSDDLLIWYYFEMNATEAAYIKAEVDAMKNSGAALPPNELVPADFVSGTSSYYIYKIELPTGLKLPDGKLQNTPMYIFEDGNKKFQYGTLYYIDTTRQEIYVIFSGDFWDNAANYQNGIQFGYIWVACELDMNEIGDDKAYTITLNNNIPINIKVKDERSEHTAQKDYELDETDPGAIIWTVEYTVGEQGKVADSVTFKDTFSDNGKQKYVADSFNVKIADKAGNAAVLQPNPTDGNLGSELINGTIEYTLDTTTYSLSPGDVVTFTYKTRLTSAAYEWAAKNNAAEIPVNNEATVTWGADLDDDVATADKTDTIPAKDLKLLEKTVWSKEGAQEEYLNGDELKTADSIVVSKESDGSHRISWKVTISLKDVNVDSGSPPSPIVFYDSFPASFSIATPSVTVTDDGGSNVPVSVTVVTNPNDPLYKREYVYTNGDVLFYFTIADGSSYSDSYTIEYQTIINDDNYFKQNITSVTIENNAGIDFTIGGGYNLPVAYTTDRIQGSTGVPPGILGINTNVIGKYGSAYNAATNTSHTITWTIEVNPNEIDIIGGTVTDTIKEAEGLIFAGNVTVVEPGGWPGTYSGAGYTVTNSLDSNLKGVAKLEITVGEIGTKKLTITYDTVVTDEFLYRVSNGTVSNTAYFTGTANTPNGIAYFEDIYDKGDVTVRSPVVSKAKKVVPPATSSYDYVNNTLKWDITVNAYKISMEGRGSTIGAVIKDTLIDGNKHLYIDDADAINNNFKDWVTVTSNGSPVTYNSGLYTVSYTDATKKVLVIELDQDICDKKTVVITLTTKVNVEKTPGFKDSDNYDKTGGYYYVDISNDATLSCPEYLNKPLTSSPASQRITNDIVKKGGDYQDSDGSIDYSIAINPNVLELSACTLTDTLPYYLKLDMDSVKLYEATVNSIGEITTTNTEVTSGWTWTYTQNPDNTKSFAITLPSDAQAYVLAYTCYVTAPTTELANSVVFKGFNNSSEFQSKATEHIQGDSYATIAARREASLKLAILKNDSETQMAMNNLEFELHTNTYSIDSGSTGNREYVDRALMDTDGRLYFYYLSKNREYQLVEIGGQYDNLGLTAHIDRINTDGIPSVNLDTFKFMLVTSTPSGDVVIENGVYKIPVKANGTAGEITLTISNDPKATIAFYKVRSDNDNTYLNKAKFSLTGITNPTYKDDATSQNINFGSGEVVFYDVPISAPSTPSNYKNEPTEYKLTEVSALPGYYKNNTEYTVKVYWDRTYTIENPDQTVFWDSSQEPDLLKVPNTPMPLVTPARPTYIYSPPSRSRRSNSSKNTITNIPIPLRTAINIAPPQPQEPENTVVPNPNDETVYIEYDSSGTPVGEWRLTETEDGKQKWIYYQYPPPNSEYSSDKYNPFTGDSRPLFLWILCFYSASTVLIALVWVNHKRKHSRKLKPPGDNE